MKTFKKINMKILISVLSDQTLPNVQIINELKNIEKYIFISSTKMEQKGVGQWIIKSMQLKAENTQSITVSDFDFEQIEQQLNTLQFNDDDQLIVNITGGTKIMTLAVYEYFRQLGAQIFYVVPNSKKYIKVFPKTRQKQYDFQTNLTVEQYIKAYGFDIKNDTPNYGSKKQAQKLLEKNLPYFDPNCSNNPYVNVILELQRIRKKVEINAIEGLNLLLEEFEFTPQKSGILSEEEIKYLTGGWLEELLYFQVIDELQIEPEYIKRGLFIHRSGVVNELDIVFVHNNKLYILEPKVSVYYYQEGKKMTTLREIVYKSDSLQDEFGLYANWAIVTLSSMRDSAGNFNQLVNDHIKRAEQFGLKIIAFAEISEQKPLKQLLEIDQ